MTQVKCVIVTFITQVTILEEPMLVALGTILIGGVLGRLIAGGATLMAAPTGARLTFGAAAGLWIGLAVAVTAAGLASAPATLPILFGIPILTAVVLALTSESFRTALASIPTRELIWVNVFRVMGAFFLFLLAAGQLGGPFPYFAGIGDILTGLLALPVARLSEHKPLDRSRMLAWNAFGMLDLLVAVTLGVLSRNNGPTQLIHAGAGSDALAVLPWSLIPFALVPVYLVIHATIFARLLRPQENAVTTSLS
jgi:hypothetical protein